MAVNAAVLLGIATALQGLLTQVSEDRVREDEQFRRALKEVLRALNKTKAYIADRTCGQPRDRAREEELSLAWTRASGELWGVDPDLAERCELKGEYWADPAAWDQDDIEQARIGIEQVSEEARSLLDQ